MNYEPTLNLDSQLVSPNCPNFRLPSWPPPEDFPVSVATDGSVISRFGESIWDLSVYSTRRLTINTGGASGGNRATHVDPANARLFRLVLGWWLWGDRAPFAPQTFAFNAQTLRPVFSLCSEHGIVASNLSRFPRVAEVISQHIRASKANHVLSQLHSIWAAREFLGFTILDREGLRRMEAALPPHSAQQTAYIPPRIWLHQVNRLRAFLDDFASHKNELLALYQYCLDAYADNYGSLAAACRFERDGSRIPFSAKSDAYRAATYRGTFYRTACEFGVGELLARWCLPRDATASDEMKIVVLSNYFSQANFVGAAYLINYSGMRLSEMLSLRTDCWSTDYDENNGPVHILRGSTTKTIADDDARWITSGNARVAVETMTSVARLRMKVALARGLAATSESEVANPYLLMRAYEPWSSLSMRDASQSIHIRTRPDYSCWRVVSPNLFDSRELVITADDARMARLVTPTLDPARFQQGNEWRFSWHQLRRTLAVNMTSSGLVSDSTLQYQLKHASRAMSLYYAQGYSRVRINRGIKEEFIRTTYEMLTLQASKLFESRYISPHGEQHKANVLRTISTNDRTKLLALAKKGLIAVRQTLLGLCMSKRPCPYGGIDNLIHCSDCGDALLDAARRPAIEELKKSISLKLLESEESSPLQQSLRAQVDSIDRTLSLLNTGGYCEPR